MPAPYSLDANGRKIDVATGRPLDGVTGRPVGQPIPYGEDTIPGKTPGGRAGDVDAPPVVSTPDGGPAAYGAPGTAGGMTDEDRERIKRLLTGAPNLFPGR